MKNKKLYCLKMAWLVVFVMFLIPETFFAQEPNISADMPQISPPSPTVAALMKFEEVPVNNYTGVPNISIPLYSVQSRSKDIGLNLSLDYHPASIAAFEVASYVGLGWNLMAGGTISRTVRGYPDELLEQKRIGIYRNTGEWVNNYYAVTEDLASMPLGDFDETEKERYNELVWETNEKGKYDTEHDLYQFNFMGRTGRFFIKKGEGNNLELVRLDNNDALKIEFAYNFSNYKINSFTVRDEKGYVYFFNIKEVTDETSISGTDEGGPGNPSSTYTYFSAYQLSNISDTNGNLLMQFIYNSDSEIIKERTGSYNLKEYYRTGYNLVYTNYGSSCDDFEERFPKGQHYSSTSCEVKTKKLQQIQVNGKAKIDFTLEYGRADENNNEAYMLKNIVVKNWAEEIIKEYGFEYGYLSTSDRIGKRLSLEKIIESNPLDTLTQEYQMYYKKDNTAFLASELTTDYWGYFNLKPECTDFTGTMYRETTPEYVTLDVLQKISLPTGGCKIFDFESNTYSHVLTEELTDFSSNPDNYTSEDIPQIDFSNTNTNPTQTFEIEAPEGSDVCVSFSAGFTCTNGASPAYNVSIYNINGGGPVAFFDIGNEPIGQEPSYPPYLIHLPAGEYKIRVGNVETQCPVFSGQFNATIRKKNLTGNKFLYGGGVRIKNIGYFDYNAPQSYYETNGSHLKDPAKEKKYNYSFFNDPIKSSGSLTFGKPSFEYGQTIINKDECYFYNFRAMYIYEVSYLIYTERNNLLAQRTQGADVGYKNITVWETDNGYTQYTYTSPIDVTEQVYDSGYPFLPYENYDYKKGLLQQEKAFNNDNRLLTETNYTYDITEGKVLTGLRTFSNENCVFSDEFTSYANYKSTINRCNVLGETKYYQCRFCGDIYEFINHKLIYEAFGWSKLKEKVTKEYFYDNNSLQGVVTTKDTITYNNLNKQIASKETEVYNEGSTIETLRKDYIYLNESFLEESNRIGEIKRIETRKNGSLIDTKNIVYDFFPTEQIEHRTTFSIPTPTPTSDSLYLPRIIQTAKGLQPLEDRIYFNKYNKYSNLLEGQQAGNNATSYILGYSNTLPIAMIEGSWYDNIPSNLITTAQSASDSGNETALLTALQAIREALPGAMVTTYTHEPLIGVKSVTDPKGLKTTYTYDSFGRLKEVRDNEGNLVSENKYHYRTQQP